MIECVDLTKSYGAARGVAGLTFAAAAGEVLGFLGPNGAGKTTTIKLLTGYFPPSSGRAVVAGLDVERDPFGARRLLGYLPENAPVYPNMTVEEFVGFFLALKRPQWRRAELRAEVDRVLGAVELLDRRRQRIAGLSKGLRQRTGLAQAIAGRPSVVILDEPTGGLDPEQVLAVRGLVRRLAAEGCTVLLSTHVLGEVEALADRAVILNEGRIVAAGTLAELCGEGAARRPLERVFLEAVAASRGRAAA